MLNIENYDQWTKVCDDDDLILELYNSGVRPDTDEFRKLLGEPITGKSASAKDKAILVGGIGIAALIMWGIVKVIKFVGRKIKQLISRIFSKKEKGSV